jgi:hypothetical protein
MAEKFTSNTFNEVYKDDFNADDNYHRILFNSGRPLQARELTQLQTIIQEELYRFGSHIFREGASVNAGNVTCTNVEYIRLNTEFYPLPENISDIIGDTFISDTTQFEFVVNDVLEEVYDSDGVTLSEPATLIISYTGSNLDSDVTVRDSDGEYITPKRIISEEVLNQESGDVTLKVETLIENAQYPVAGQGTKLAVETGDFFAAKHFVESNEQSIYLSKYVSLVNTTVGFKVIQDIVTVDDTVDLYDNQGDTPNLTSPGADRYRIRLVLEEEKNVNSEDNFIPIATVENSIVVSQINQGVNEIYNKLGDNIARRTYEESGDYIADRFTLRFEEGDSDNAVNFVVSPGIAYINGYRAEINRDEVISVNKPRKTQLFTEETVPVEYGNYLLMETNGSKGLPDISTFEELTLKKGRDFLDSDMGTVRVRSIEKDGDDLRFYLFDFNILPGQRESEISSIGSSTNNYFNVNKDFNNTRTIRKDVSGNDLLFNFPNAYVANILEQPTSFVAQRQFNETTNSSGEVTIGTSGSSDKFTDSTLWIASKENGELVNITNNPTLNQSTTTLVLEDDLGLVTNQNVTILTYVFKEDAQPRAKSKNEITETLTPDLNGNITLSNADIINVIDILDSDENGSDLSGRYSVDNGQRDNYYGLGKLNLIPGSTPPSNNVYIKYEYYSHGNGDFFCINSYPEKDNVETYGDIPVYTSETGDEIPLRDVVDFRPTQSSDGSFSNININELPRNTDLFQTDVNYYMPKNAKVVINESGVVDVIEGKDAMDPKMPTTPPTALDLYLVEMAPFMITPKDLGVTAVEAKRYTMKDIGDLEERLANLEETTALSMLELSTSSFQVLDNDGNIRTKSGFYVDNFVDQSRAKVDDVEYRASIDPSRQIMRPSFRASAIKLVPFEQSNNNVNAEISGDFIHLKIKDREVVYQEQPFATGTENVNPFSVVSKRGVVTLSPSKDTWMETRYLTDKITYGDDKFNVDQNQLWDNWSWNWTGNEKVGTVLGTQDLNSRVEWGRTTRGRLLNTTTRRGGNTRTTTRTFETIQSGRRITDTAAAVVTGFSTIREVVGDKLISRTLIPKMRSQKIFFRGGGLRPNTRLFPFFGGEDISEWCIGYGSESEYNSNRLQSRDSDYSSGFESVEQHPDVPTPLYTNDRGEVYGSFFLPSTEVESYQTGTKEFRLLDISSYENRDDSITWASTNYSSIGYLNTRQRTILSTRIVNIDTRRSTRVDTISRRDTTTNVTTRQVGGGGDGGGGGGPDDPLAQTFTVDEEYGVYLTGVKLYFDTVATSNEVPVFVQIRPTVNGYPSADSVIPGTTVIKGPNDINLPGPNQGPVETYFEFEAPAYLSGNGTEYAICVLSNSNEYNVHVGEAGEFLIDSNGNISTERRLRRQPTLGSLFKSQNSRTWEPDQTKDLMYTLTRAQFETSGSYVVKGTSTPTIMYNTNELYTELGQSTIYVVDPSHGFNVHDKINVSIPNISQNI